MPGSPSAPRRAALALILCFIAACSDDDGSGPAAAAPEPSARFQRLLVTDATQPTARLLDLGQGDAVIGTYALIGPASLVYSTHSGRFAAIQQRTRGRVQFVDGGVWTDGELGHRRSAAMLTFDLRDSLPTHENVNGNWISVFFDGTGIARWMNEADKIAGTPRVAFEVNTGGPHHSGSATLTVGTTPFFIYAPRNPTATLPSAVEVVNQQRQVVARVDNCPSMHGNSATRDFAAFGCQDGMVLVRPSGGSVTAVKLAPTGELAGLGLRNAYAATDAPWILGQFGAPPGQPTVRRLALISPDGTINPLPPLPTGVVDHQRVIEPIRREVVVLGTDGAIYVYDGATRALRQTIRDVVPTIPTSGATAHQMAVAEGLAVVASPTQGQVVVVNTTAGTIVRRIAVGGTPSRLALLGARRNAMFRPAP